MFDVFGCRACVCTCSVAPICRSTETLTLFVLFFCHSTADEASLALAQLCLGGAQYLVDSGLTTLIYSAVLLFFGILVPCLFGGKHPVLMNNAQDAGNVASCCMGFLFFGRFVIEVAFAVLGGVLFFNSQRYSCGAELFGFGLGLSIVFVFSSLSTCNGCCAAGRSKNEK